MTGGRCRSYDTACRESFVIGAPKTGTTSAGDALRWIGYRVSSWPVYRLYNCLLARDLGVLNAEIEAHDAFEDLPWTVLYKVVDHACPDSKFILTVRDDARWIRSMVGYNGIWHDVSRQFLMGYGAPDGYEAEHLEWYRNHNHAVIAHFRERPEQLLVVKWENGDGWDELGSFLGVETPDRPFPHLKRARYGGAIVKLHFWLAGLVRVLRRMRGPQEQRAPDFDPEVMWEADSPTDPPAGNAPAQHWKPSLTFRIKRWIAGRF